MNKDALIQKLLRADEDAFFMLSAYDFSTLLRSEVVIVGGSALLLCNLSQKVVTKDVDIFQMKADKIVADALFSDFTFNAMSAAFSQNIPYNFEDRLRKIDLDTRVIDYYIPSLEDLAVMKLYRWEEPDKADLTAESFLQSVNWGLLEKLVYDPTEAAASRCARPEHDRGLKEMRANFEELRCMVK